MAYSTANPPKISAQGVGDGRIWHYATTDTFATVGGADYFTNALELGIKVNDLIVVTNTAINSHRMGGLASLSASAGTMTFSDAGGPIISGLGATRTLTAAESGSLVLLDRAAGIALTLPAPVIGLKYRFFTTVAVTSNAYSVVTDAASTFLVGYLQTIINASAVTLGSVANGTSHRTVSMNGTTSGGLVGTAFEVECITSTKFELTGTAVGSGTLVATIS